MLRAFFTAGQRPYFSSRRRDLPNFSFFMASLSSQSLGPRSTGEEVIEKLGVSLVGKNIVVTGASSGIGAEAARYLK